MNDEPQQGLPHIGALLRDEAMARVNANANDVWKIDARRAVEDCAAVLEVLTTDDVWALLKGTGSTTTDNRAMGPLMLKAATDGILRHTDKTRLSRRPQCHRRPVRVWRSLVYRGSENTRGEQR